MNPCHHLDSYSHLSTLASPQSYRLAILLKFRYELIALLDHIVVLLVLVIWSVGLDDALASYSVDCAWNALGCNELGEVTEQQLAKPANENRKGRGVPV